MRNLLRLFIIVAITLCPVVVNSQATICGQTATVSVAAGSTTAIITPDPGQTIGVCGWAFTANTAATGVQLKTGTGTSCATGCVSRTDVMLMALNSNLVVIKDNELFASGTGNIVYVAATTGTVTGFINYRSRP